MVHAHKASRRSATVSVVFEVVAHTPPRIEFLGPRGLHNPSTDLLVTALVYTGGILHAVRACRSGPTAPYLRPVCPLHLGGGRLPGPRRQRDPRQ